MKPNMGTIDRLIRLFVAATITFLYLRNIISGTTGIILVIVAFVFLFTSLVGFCPLYRPFGLSTRKRN